MQEKNNNEVSHGGLHNNGWVRPNEKSPDANNGGMSAQKMGERKALTEQVIIERRDGKRYRLVDKEEDDTSDDEAVAAE
jgi:hypothetical protein